MPNIDSRPQVIDIDHYAGDTLTLHVKVPALVVDGRAWTAQVRSRTDSQRIAATFQITETAEGADVVLLSEDCQRLAKRGKFVGMWDVQLAGVGGADPVTTLVYGELRIHPDVTRTS